MGHWQRHILVSCESGHYYLYCERGGEKWIYANDIQELMVEKESNNEKIFEKYYSYCKELVAQYNVKSKKK